MRRRLTYPFAGAAALAGAVAFGTRALASRVTRVRPERQLNHLLVAVDGETVVLRADEETRRPGRYGIYWRDGHAVLGDVVAADARTVRRRVESVGAGTLQPGKFGFGYLHYGDPSSAHGVAFAEPTVPTEVGEIPLWEISGRDDLWVILLHGYRGSRVSALSFVPLLRSLGLSILVVSYRNDPDAPAGGDGHYHLGGSEWEEVAAAAAYARSQGARRIVLFGWSMGAAIALQAYDRMDDRALVAGLVLDSPVLDWRAVLFHQAARRHVPRLLMRLVLRRVARTARIDYRVFDWIARSGELEVPVLIFHSSDDPIVPATESHELARRRSDLVTLVDDERAGHFGTFNVDPDSYEATVRAFLARVLGL